MRATGIWHILPLLRRNRAPPRPDAAVLAFQDDLDALVGERPPLLLRLWPLLGLALLAALIAAAALARIDVVVTATGRLATASPPVVLQPMDRAVLRDLPVRAGERVRAGQVVAVLDATFTAADREALQAQQRSLAAHRDRLEAELTGAAQPPATDREGILQTQLATQRGAVHAARLSALAAELAALAAAREGERRSATGLAAQLGVATEVEAMRARLLESQVGSRIALLGARSARLEAEEALQRHGARLEELDLRITARAAERDAYLRDWQRQVAEDLARIRPELARVEELLAKAQRMDALTLLRAPRDAIVLETARRSPGSLIREGETVVVLVPIDSELVAEVGLRSADIGRLSEGNPARLKIDAFPWRRHGALEGTLRTVSRDSYPDPTGGALHRGHLSVSDATPARMPDGATLLPGMTLTAEIKVGTRSVLEFFLEPLLRALDESLHEP
jgi:HlyD family secretion protein